MVRATDTMERKSRIRKSSNRGGRFGRVPANGKHLDIYICARLNCVSTTSLQHPPFPVCLRRASPKQTALLEMKSGFPFSSFRITFFQDLLLTSSIYIYIYVYNRGNREFLLLLVYYHLRLLFSPSKSILSFFCAARAL